MSKTEELKTEDDLLNALQTIKKYCESFSHSDGCDKCKLSIHGDCGVCCTPSEWDINIEKKYKLFLEE